ncbi:MAG: dihydrodipicolinate synthase family protein [bacterium]
MGKIRHPITGQEVPQFLTDVIVPVFTPCGPGGAIDWDGFKNFVVWLRDHPAVNTLFVRCGLGKMYTYTVSDTKRAIDVTMEALDGKKQAMFGTFGEYFRNGVPSGADLSHYRTIGKNRPDPAQYFDQTLELTEYASAHGAAASVLVVPSALAPSRRKSVEETVFEYYEKVSNSCDIPLFIYNTPGLPKPYNTTPQMAARFSKLRNVAGMKLSTNDLEWITEILMMTEGADFVMIAGSESVFYHALCAGACGAIGQGSDITPEILHAVFSRFMAGDYAGALEAQKDIQRAQHLFDRLPVPYAGLAYLSRHGLKVPLYGRFGEPPVRKSTIDRIQKELDPIIAKYSS